METIGSKISRIRKQKGMTQEELSELAKINLRKETPLIQLIDSPILPLEKEKVSKRNSLVLGGILAGFLTILYFILSKLIKKLLS